MWMDTLISCVEKEANGKEPWDGKQPKNTSLYIFSFHIVKKASEQVKYITITCFFPSSK